MSCGMLKKTDINEDGKYVCNIMPLLKQRGMTQVRAAELCEMRQQNFGQFALGHANPSRATAERIALGLGVTIGELWPALADREHPLDPWHPAYVKEGEGPTFE